LDIVDGGLNSETHALLGYWDFHGRNVDDAWHFLKWIAWDSFEFEKATCAYRYSIPNPRTFYCRSYYAPFWCDYCNSSDHDINSCPYYACYT